jgi:hypothetical protein
MFLATEKANKSEDGSLGFEQRPCGFQAAGHLTWYSERKNDYGPSFHRP